MLWLDFGVQARNERRCKVSVNHHGKPEQSELWKRFQEQLNGTAKREYPTGRMGAEDDGVLAYAMANDDKHGAIIMRFGKPVEWIAFGIKEAEELQKQLAERILALKGIRT